MEVTSCSKSRGQESSTKIGQGFMPQRSSLLYYSCTIEALSTGGYILLYEHCLLWLSPAVWWKDFVLM